MIGVRQPPARKLPNLAAARGLRALEVLVFHPAAAPGLAAAMGLDQRTARRLLFTLEDEGYLQRGHGTHRQRYVYSPTPRLLALAGQLAARLPLMTRGHQVVRDLHQRTGLDAYLVIPSYGDVIVLASSGERAPAPWSLLPATDSAGGKVLLAYRDSWRDDQRLKGTINRVAPQAASR
jgi:DNA-binding IclR family transcriptional regulator